MVGELINKTYKYTDVALASGAKVTANNVVTKDDKVEIVDSGNVTVKVGEMLRSFSFSIYNYGINGEKTYNLNNVPEGVDGQAIVKEFVDFVEKDIA